jgi:antitoxin YefM
VPLFQRPYVWNQWGNWVERRLDICMAAQSGKALCFELTCTEVLSRFMKTTTYSAARERFASLIEDVIATREVALITRRGYEPVAIIPAEELVGLLETAHLLRSPKNVRRLLEALLRSYQGADGGTEMSLDEIRLFVAH